MKQIYRQIIAAITFLFIVAQVQAQVTVTATAGTTGPTNYTTLNDAFTAINAGTHQGDVVIGISANTTETVPAVLNSSGAGSALYTTVLIQPTADNVSVSGAMATGRGVIELKGADNVTINGDNPNSAGTNRNLSIINTAAATVAYTSVVRIAVSATVAASSDNITIKNCIITGNATGRNAAANTSTSGSEGATWGIYAGGGGGATATDAPAALSSTGTTAPSGTTINNLLIDNNAINACARGFHFNGSVLTNSTGVTATGNVIGDQSALSGVPPYNTPATTVYLKGIIVQGLGSVNISGNTIKNTVGYVALGSSAIELTTLVGDVGGSISINNNIITGVVTNNTSGYVANGILIGAAALAYNVNNNTITNIQTASSASAAAINITATAPSGNVMNNRISYVYARSTGGYAARGILISGGNNVTIQNNMIWDLNAVNNNSTTSTTYAVKGISLAAGNGHKVYHNTVSLYGAMLGASTAADNTTCFMIAASSQTGIDVRNNLFSNTMSGASATAHACVQLPSGATSSMNLTINNNAYYTGTAANNYAMMLQSSFTSYTAANFNSAAITPATNARAYTSTLSAAGTNDNASFAVSFPAPFVSATDLHISPTVTKLESRGAAVGVAVDIDGDARPGPVGSVNGGATAADIGADEFDGFPVSANDMSAVSLIAPVSGGSVAVGGTFSPQASFRNTGLSTQTNVTVRYRIIDAGNAVIYDNTQVIASLATDATTTVTFASANIGAAGVYTIRAIAELAGDAVSSNDIVSGTLNVFAPLCGTYHVGSGQASPFNTLTNAISTLKVAGVSCAVTFLLDDANYSTNETFPIIITDIVGASSTNTITIKPNTGVSPLISGNNTVAILRLSGADYITIDGSNAGTSSKNLTIQNTSTGTSSVLIWVGSTSASNGATNNTIKNCIIKGNSSATTFSGIVSSSGTTVGGVAEAANSGNSYINNEITGSYYGAAFVGVAAGDAGLTVTNNIIGSGTVANKLGLCGLFVSSQTGFNVSNNTVLGISSTATGTASNAVVNGINILGASQNGEVKNNIITDVKNTNSSGYSAYGIQLASTVAASNVSVYNNMISDIAAAGNATIGRNAHGIIAVAGGGYNIYYNSVYLNGSQAAAGISAALTITTGVSATAGLKILNNILVNKETAGNRYAIYSAVTAANTATAFTDMNYNAYWSAGANMAYMSEATRLDLAALQGAYGNTNSVQANLVFTSNTDLHMANDIANLPIDNGGTPIAGITTDIDNATRNVTTPDIGADEFSLVTCVSANGGTVTALTTELCLTGSTTLSSTGYSNGLTINYQWQYSSDNFVADINDLPGETNPISAATGTISQSTYYRLKVVCTTASLTGYSNIVKVTVNDPQILTSNGGTRCGVGTVALSATSSPGATVKWYGSATGGALLGTGTSFNTPVISSTTTYYAEASIGGNVSNVGPERVAALDYYITSNWGITFNCTAPTVIQSVAVYPQSAGSLTIAVQSSMTTPTIFGTYTATFTAAQIGTKVIVPINIAIPTPGTGYKMIVQSYTGLSGLQRETAPAPGFPYTTAGSDVSITSSEWGGTTTSTYYFFYDWVVGSSCSSARTSVDAIVNTPPTLTIGTGKTICNNAVASLEVTSTLANFNSYTWSPQANLFSNAAATVPYAGENLTKVYFKTSTAGKYVFNLTANNSTTLCADVVKDSIIVLPVVTINPATATVCLSGSVALSASPSSANYGAASFQWQESPDGTSYSDIGGEVNKTFTSPVISTSTYYKLLVKDEAGAVCSQPSVNVVVNDPQVTGTTGGTRCGTGTVSLGATANAGASLNWYANATGGTSLGTGTTFVTPVISTTTDYYVSAVVGTVGNTAKPAPSSVLGGNSAYTAGLAFNATAPFTLTSVDVYLTGSAGSCNIQLQNSSGTVLAETGVINFPAGNAAAPVLYTIPLNFNVPVGNAHRIVRIPGSVAFAGGEAAWTSPIALEVGGTPFGQITSGYWFGTVSDYYFFYNWQVSAGCESPRTAVTAIVNTPPVLTIGTGKTICNNAISSLEVTSTIANFDSYIWSPQTNLFTDAAATVPYTGASATKVYFKTATAGKYVYTMSANNGTTLCADIVKDSIIVLPDPTITASRPQICVSGTTTLSLNPATANYGAATFQWQESANGTTYGDIGGETNPSYTSPTLSAGTYYKVIIKDESGNTCAQPSIAISVNDPQIITSNAGTRCGPGSVTLNATAGGGQVIKWYANASGGTALGTGTSFNTPSISTTTTYYAEASVGSSANVGPVRVAALDYFITSNWGITFNATAPTVIQSVAVYPQSAGTLTIAVQSSMSSPTVFGTYTATFTAAEIGTKVIVPINITIPAAGTGYKMIVQSYSGLTGLHRESAPAPGFPYSTPGADVTITSSEWGGTTTSTYYFFYDWVVGASCASSRVAVDANVNTPPAITSVTATPTEICAGGSANIQVSSTNAGYTYSWTPGGQTGNSISVSPSVATKYVVLATDNSGGAFNGCTNSDSIVLLVNPVPSAMSVTPASASLCASTSPAQMLTANGGTLTNVPLLSEGFNGATNSWTTINNSTGGGAANTPWTLQPDGYTNTGGTTVYTFHSNDNSQFYLTNADFAASGIVASTILQSPVFSTVGYTSAELKFYHYYKTRAAQTGKVEISTDNTNWTTLKTYTGTDVGTSVAFALETIDLTTYINYPTVYIRFKFDAAWDWFWAIDNVAVTGSQSTDITWTPVTGLFMNAAATIPYTNGTVTNVVYALPGATTTYTAKATSPSSCTNSKTVTVTSNCPVPVTLLAFKGENKGSINKLYWSTSTEKNNKGFELERSVDGINFSKIAFVATKAESGNSNSVLNYTYDDNRPFAGNNYYRLKQVDRDGKFSYSNVILLRLKPASVFISSIYPNPATKDVKVVINSPAAERITLMVTDISGKILLQKTMNAAAGDTIQVLDVSAIASGSYIIKAVCANGCETAIHKFVKQ